LLAIGDSKLGRVTGTFRHRSARVLDLYVEGLAEPIGTTANHPFFSADEQRFKRADELRPGERLQSLAGTPQVVRIEQRPASQPVYNLEVQVDHVYHVGSCGLLVPNGELAILNNCPWYQAAPVKGWRSTQAFDTSRNSKILRENMGDLAKSGEDAHHVVASTHRRAAEARDLLDAHQIDINDAANGVSLDPSIHHGNGLHSYAGIDEVTRRLNASVQGVDDFATRRQLILEELDNIRNDIESGAFFEALP
jgi:hypothetical protein